MDNTEVIVNSDEKKEETKVVKKTASKRNYAQDAAKKLTGTTAFAKKQAELKLKEKELKETIVTPVIEDKSVDVDLIEKNEVSIAHPHEEIALIDSSKASMSDELAVITDESSDLSETYQLFKDSPMFQQIIHKIPNLLEFIESTTQLHSRIDKIPISKIKEMDKEGRQNLLLQLENRYMSFSANMPYDKVTYDLRDEIFALMEIINED